jgi:4-hydroxybutyrate CoA-transferase
MQTISDYKSKVTTAEEALQLVKSGDNIYVHSNAAAPRTLIRALVESAPRLRNVQIFHLLTLGDADYAAPQYAESFKVHALFIGKNVREAVNAGRADYTPVFLSEIPRLFKENILPVDVCLLNLSVPDEHGYCSYGVSVDCSIAARRSARVTIAQINKRMPRTMGRAFVHISKIDRIVEVDEPIPELEMGGSSKEESAIARYIADLIEDGSTLQMGIGGIPNAVLSYLTGKKGLGIHTEMFSDGLVDLVEKGVVTNDAKTILPGKCAVSFMMGSKRLYDFANNNPIIEMQASDFINDPFIISQNYRMVAINSAIEVDLTGQVCSDSIGDKLYSGFGGQVDFIRGAARAKEGKAIIALLSTAKDGECSRIVPHVSGGVVTSRADVHYVVTEYGVAHLFGKNLKERAKALIAIAHPKFREDLERECHSIPYLS